MWRLRRSPRAEDPCGDGLRGGARRASCSPPITRTATFVQWKRRYEGAIPFYGLNGELPAYGLTVKRGLLDATLLQAAARAGAVVHEQTTVRDVTAQSGGIEVTATRGSHSHRYSARLVVGADGANSVVARRVGLACDDPRRTVLAQRAYAQAAPQDDDACGRRGVLRRGPVPRLRLGLPLWGRPLQRRGRDARRDP